MGGEPAITRSSIHPTPRKALRRCRVTPKSAANSPSATSPAKQSEPPRTPRPQESAAELARTSMCAEPRNGVLYIFMPPRRSSNTTCELVAAVEAAAEELSPARHPRGLRAAARPAPRDLPRDAGSGRHRSQRSSVGAIGTSSSERTTFLYEAAREIPLDQREVHAGRPARRHGRRQSLRARRRQRPAIRRSCAARICCAACCPTGTTIPSLSYLVFRFVHRTHLAGAARR